MSDLTDERLARELRDMTFGPLSCWCGAEKSVCDCEKDKNSVAHFKTRAAEFLSRYSVSERKATKPPIRQADHSYSDEPKGGGFIQNLRADMEVQKYYGLRQLTARGD